MNQEANTQPGSSNNMPNQNGTPKSPRLLNRNTAVLLFALVFLVGLAGAIFLFQRENLVSIFGLPATRTTLKLSPQGLTQTDGRYELPYDQDIVVDVVLNTGESEVDSVEAKINYDPNVLSAKEIIYTNNEFTELSNTLVSSIKKNGDVEQGLITISRTAIPLPPYPDPDNLPAYNPAPANSEGVVASIVFHVNQDVDSSSVTFDFTLEDNPNTPEKENKNDSNVVKHNSNGEDVLGSVENISFGSAPVGDTATLYFDPANTTMKVNQRTEVKVMLDTGGNDVDSIDAIINYDKSTLNMTEVVNGTGFANLVPPSGSPIIDVNNAIVRFSTNIGTGETLTPVNGSAVHVATLVMTPTAPGTATLTYQYDGFEAENDSNVVAYLQGRDILEVVDGGTYPVEDDGTTGADITLDLELFLQGRQRPQADKSAPVRLILRNKSNGNESEFNFNLDSTGKKTGIPLVGITAGEYDAFIKPIGYLQKLTSMTLQTGTNAPDLSAIIFLGGDLDLSGKVNVLDYNNMLTQWNKSRGDNVDAAVADLDGSNIVNSLDYSILISNFNSSGDNEGDNAP